MQTHTIRFSDGLWQRVKAISAREGIAASEWVRRQAEIGLERAEERERMSETARELAELRVKVERIERALARRGR